MTSSLTLQPRHRLDLRPADLAHGALALPRRGRAVDAVLGRAGVPDDGLVTLSVRSGWHLLLEAADWPAGAEVVVSGVTHPEMAALVVAAGHRPVPVDVDLETLLPDPEAVEAAITPRTRAVLVAQLFGARAELAELAALTRRRGLLLVEDAAQAWVGPGSLRSAADVTLVSFGLLKTATAVGGAVLRVADPVLRRRMETVASGWPVQPRRAYALRLLRAALLLLVARVPCYGALLLGCRALGHDPDAVLENLCRGAQAPSAARLRFRASAPLLALLARRLSPLDPSVARVRARTAAGERLRAGLPAGTVPGDRVQQRTHWLFPVRTADPAGLVRRLRAAGADASTRTSNLVALAEGGAAADLMGHVVYVPCPPEVPAAVADAVARVVRAELGGSRGRSPAHGCRSAGSRIVR